MRSQVEPKSGRFTSDPPAIPQSISRPSGHRKQNPLCYHPHYSQYFKLLIIFKLHFNSKQERVTRFERECSSMMAHFIRCSPHSCAGHQRRLRLKESRSAHMHEKWGGLQEVGYYFTAFSSFTHSHQPPTNQQTFAQSVPAKTSYRSILFARFVRLMHIQYTFNALNTFAWPKARRALAF